MEDLIFIGVDRLDAKGWWQCVAWDFWKAVVDAHDSADVMQQRVFACIGKVGMADPGGISTSCGAATADYKLFAVVALSEEEGFMARGIDGIDDGIVVMRQNLVGGFFGKKLLELDDFRVGVDVADAFGHGAGFLAADVGGGGVELAIDIGDADVIHIHEGDFSDSGAGECFGCP